LSALLRLMAPFLPYITEEIWSWAFAGETGLKSIHHSPWPAADEYKAVPEPESDVSFETAVAALAAIHKEKTLAHMSAGTEIESLTIKANPAAIDVLKLVVGDVMSGARVLEYTLQEDPAIEDGVFTVEDVVFAKKTGGN